MEALEALEGEKYCHLDFCQFVRSIELDEERSMLSRRNRLLRRQKSKESWLVRSKILPPCYARLGEEIFPNIKSADHILQISSFPDNRKTTPLQDCQDAFRTLYIAPTTPSHPRQQCKTSHAALRNSPSYDRLKANWKLEFRRDQLNILKYRRQEEEMPEPDVSSTTKSFKLRRVQKKFEEVKPGKYHHYRTNIGVLKQSNGLSPKIRFRNLKS